MSTFLQLWLLNHHLLCILIGLECAAYNSYYTHNTISLLESKSTYAKLWLQIWNYNRYTCYLQTTIRNLMFNGPLSDKYSFINTRWSRV